MVRPIRIEYEGGFYHVTSRGNAQQNIFLDARDYRAFIHVLSDVVERFRWILHAYCLMNNHYHLLVETPQANLSTGMRQLNGVYTQKFNRRYRRPGHLFQGRYKAFIVEKENYLLELSRYIVLNPIRAGLVSSINDWPWSSYEVTTGTKEGNSFVHTDGTLNLFSPSTTEARIRYSSFVKGGLGITSPLKNAKGGLLLGKGEFIENIRDKIKSSETGESTLKEKYAARPSLEEIFAGKERNEGIYEAVHKWGYKLKEVGNFINLHYAWVSKIAASEAKNKT